MKTHQVVVLSMMFFAVSYPLHAEGPPATAPVRDPQEQGDVKEQAERKVTSLSAALTDAIKSDANFSQATTRQILKDLLEALFAERVSNPDKAAGLDKYGIRLMALYKSVGVDPGIPFPIKTQEDTETLIKMAVKHPYFAKEPPQPGSPTYEDLKKDLPDFVAMELATSMNSILGSSDDFFADLQKRFKNNPDLASEDTSMRPALLTARLKLLREGRLPE